MIWGTPIFGNTHVLAWIIHINILVNLSASLGSALGSSWWLVCFFWYTLKVRKQDGLRMTCKHWYETCIWLRWIVLWIVPWGSSQLNHHLGEYFLYVLFPSASCRGAKSKERDPQQKDVHHREVVFFRSAKHLKPQNMPIIRSTYETLWDDFFNF